MKSPELHIVLQVWPVVPQTTYLKRDCNWGVFSRGYLRIAIYIYISGWLQSEGENCSQGQCRLNVMWKETGPFNGQPCWKCCFLPLLLCDLFHLPTCRYCSSAGAQRQMETTSVHCIWTALYLNFWNKGQYLPHLHKAKFVTVQERKELVIYSNLTFLLFFIYLLYFVLLKIYKKI